MASAAPEGDAAASTAPSAPAAAPAAAVPAAEPMSVDSDAKPTEAPAAPAKEAAGAVKAEEKAEGAKEEAKPKSSLDEQTLYRQVKAVLMNAELSKTTVRSIAEQLNILFGYDFADADNKAVLKAVVTRVLDEREPSDKKPAAKQKERDEPARLPPKKAARTEEKSKPKEESEGEEEEEDEEEGESGEEEESDESDEKPKSRRRTSAPAVSPAAAKKKRNAPEAHGGRHEELVMSPALENVIHVKFATRLDATKFLWDYIYGLNLVDGNFIACDDKLKELFGEEKVRSTQVEKRLTAHLSHKDGTPLLGKKPAKKEKKEKDPNKPKRSSIFSAEKILAQPLAELLGKERMSRGDVVKALHEYFKANNLQDPKNRTVINFDAKLEAVFHRKKTTFFKLNKLLVGKLMDPSEVV